MKYIQVSGNDGSSALCSDDACPCGNPGATIARGEGYIYVSQKVAEFRSDALTEAEAQTKIQRITTSMGFGMVMAGSGVFAPILMCEQGANKRGIDLDVAAADAKHWWETGKVPCRSTPHNKKWWQFWK